MRLLVAGLILMTACVARAQDLAKPMVLVASPDLAGPYSHTALIVVPMGDRHIGFILNRATESRLATLFPEHAPSAKVADPLFYGGPEAAGAVFALLRRDPGQPSIRLFDDLFVTGNGRNIDSIIEQTPNDARYLPGSSAGRRASSRRRSRPATGTWAPRTPRWCSTRIPRRCGRS